MYMRWVRINRNASVFARPNGIRENTETAFLCRRPGPGRKKKGIPVD